MFPIISKPVCKPVSKGLVSLGGEFNARYIGWTSPHLTSAVRTIKNISLILKQLKFLI